MLIGYGMWGRSQGRLQVSCPELPFPEPRKAVEETSGSLGSLVWPWEPAMPTGSEVDESGVQVRYMTRLQL